MRDLHRDGRLCEYRLSRLIAGHDQAGLAVDRNINRSALVDPIRVIIVVRSALAHGVEKRHEKLTERQASFDFGSLSARLHRRDAGATTTVAVSELPNTIPARATTVGGLTGCLSLCDVRLTGR